MLLIKLFGATKAEILKRNEVEFEKKKATGPSLFFLSFHSLLFLSTGVQVTVESLILI